MWPLVFCVAIQHVEFCSWVLLVYLKLKQIGQGLVFKFVGGGCGWYFFLCSRYLVQFSLVPQSCPTLCDPMECSTPGFPVHHQLLELAHTYWVSNAIQPSHPLSFPSLPAFNFSQHQGIFQWVSYSHQWPKDWSLSFSISPSNEYLGLISFRIDWFDLLAVQRTLNSLFQHNSSKASFLWFSAFFIV